MPVAFALVSLFSSASLPIPLSVLSFSPVTALSLSSLLDGAVSLSSLPDGAVSLSSLSDGAVSLSFVSASGILPFV